MALPAYRSLLRAARVAFQGDERVLSAARAEIRKAFHANASLEPSSPAAADAIQHSKQIAMILRQNLVQGKLEGEAYKLRIHDETERGDNDTVKIAGGSTLGGPKCCSS
ncbi:hypothetical protein GGR56DRAFT_463403 [Xylariaceae sp. FL0804]|nr:hypothetical protein GGR56DRAFT_463403 [Xylariaceae sp. FL0804]